MKKLFYLTAFQFIFHLHLGGLTHNHPTPSLPKNINVFTCLDVFGISLISQIHKTLFVLDENKPIPELIDDFTVSKDQKTYTLNLKNKKFHNNARLTYKDVKYTFESFIKHKTVGFEKLSPIIGFQSFSKGHSISLKGIKRGSSNFQLIIKLNSPYPGFLYNLTEYKFSIVPSTGEKMVGLGDYRIKEFSQNKVILKLSSSNFSHSPDLIKYHKVDRDTAISGFLEGKYHDLFDYSIEKKDITRFSNIANVQLLYFPRTYLIALNARSIPDINKRSTLLNDFNVSTLINRCYPGNQQTVSLVPPGFLGYIKHKPNTVYEPELNKVHEYRNDDNNNTIPVSYMNVSIAKGVGKEACVQEELNKWMKLYNNFGFKITVDDTADLVNKWNKNQIDIMFAYLEADDTFNFFQFFNPEASFTLGTPNDNVIIRYLNGFNLDFFSSDNVQKATDLSRHVLDIKTVLPLFHPRQYLVYNKRYKQFHSAVRSAFLINYSQLKTIDDDEY